MLFQQSFSGCVGQFLVMFWPESPQISAYQHSLHFSAAKLTHSQQPVSCWAHRTNDLHQFLSSKCRSNCPFTTSAPLALPPTTHTHTPNKQQCWALLSPRAHVLDWMQLTTWQWTIKWCIHNSLRFPDTNGMVFFSSGHLMRPCVHRSSMRQNTGYTYMPKSIKSTPNHRHSCLMADTEKVHKDTLQSHTDSNFVRS